MNQTQPLCFFVCFVCFVVKIGVLIPNSGCQSRIVSGARLNRKSRKRTPQLCLLFCSKEAGLSERGGLLFPDDFF